jgi:anionic cell wall polymer biosynthesis LytR-Cps2A-Psr (LCP) family protein
LTSPHRLSALMDAMRKSVTTDPGMNLTMVVQEAQALLAGKIEFLTIPVVNSNARSPSGQSIVQVNVPQVHQFVAGLTRAPQPTTKSGPTSMPAQAKSAQTKPAPTTVNPPAPRAPTPPVSIGGVPCVD